MELSSEKIKQELKTSRDTKGSRYGMWLFLYTEIMLFGGLFVLYAAYFHRYMDDFVAAGKDLLFPMGAANTAILLVSSFFVASAVKAFQTKSKRTSLVFLAVSIMMGLVFLGNKYYEWAHEFSLGVYPGSEILLQKIQGEIVFFGLYFTITGLHALHVFIGITVLSLCSVLIIKNKIFSDNSIFLENCGLYWHLVDIIWIFIFPLFYLLL